MGIHARMSALITVLTRLPLRKGCFFNSFDKRQGPGEKAVASAGKVQAPLYRALPATFHRNMMLQYFLYGYYMKGLPDCELYS